MKLKDLADALDCRLDGDAEAEIARVAGLEDAGPGDLSFFANPRYGAALRRTRATAVILGPEVADAPCATLRTPHPYVAFARALSASARARTSMSTSGPGSGRAAPRC